MSICSPLFHITTKFPPDLEMVCPLCSYRIEFQYPGRKRTIKSLHSKFTETRYYYCCTNPMCYYFSTTFNPSPSYTLPEKHYSKDVWKWIGREAKVYNANAAKIHERILNEFSLDISENTIRNIIDEIDGYLVHQVDEETKKRVQLQGKIIIALDGQKPEDGKEGLWLFTDVISNRVLDVQILRTADHITLYDCVARILTAYKVDLVGLLSDKQGSIVKMQAEFYPTVPHQYCQYHFLQNLWNFIETRDSALQTTLRSLINHLPITTMSKTSTRNIPDRGRVNFREYFDLIEKDLHKLVKNRGEKFEKLRGTISFERTLAYVKDIQQVCAENSPDHRVSKILTRTAEIFTKTLNEQQSEHQSLVQLFESFQRIRDGLNATNLTSTQHKQKVHEIFQEIWQSIGTSRRQLFAIKTRLPNKNMNDTEVKEQWYRMYCSYSPGLFRYYEFPVHIRTNSNMEQHFSQEKFKFIQQSGKPNVSRQIRVRGDSVLKMQYVDPAEIKSYLELLPGSYSHDDVYKHLLILHERQSKESQHWQSNIGGIAALRALYDHENK